MSISETPCRRGGCIVLIDVPPGSSITLDGITRVTPPSQNQSLHGFNRGVFIVDSITTPSLTSCHGEFHLLVVRCGTATEASINHNASGGSLPVGFVLFSNPAEDARLHATNYGYDWIFVRKYNQHTEEISNKSLDEEIERNLMLAITQPGGELKQCAMNYEQFMASSKEFESKSNITSWNAQASFIDPPFLQNRRRLCHGDKIVPSSDASCTTSALSSEYDSSACPTETDGTSFSYPPIPCIDRSINARQLTQHSGTKSYLSGLPPDLRTWLLLGGECKSTTKIGVNTGPERYVWDDILGRYYSQHMDEGRDKVLLAFLADIQLSFLGFLFLECQSSLEHWRDAISLISLTTASAPIIGDDGHEDARLNCALIEQPSFYVNLLSILLSQLSCIETDFFQEVEYSSGESNFLIGALRRLCCACDRLDGRNSMIETVKSASVDVRQLVWNRFHVNISQSHRQIENPEDVDVTMDSPTAEVNETTDQRWESTELTYEDDHDDDSTDEDGPVIVSIAEVEASIARSFLQSHQTPKRNAADDHEHRENYPLLYAAMTQHEDELMACARILDAGIDVSLVREAAAYLEEVEARRI